jgi:hypothetical protein
MDDFDTDALKMIRLGLREMMQKRKDVLEDVLFIDSLIRFVDLKLDVAADQDHDMEAWANLDLFERRKAGNE